MQIKDTLYTLKYKIENFIIASEDIIAFFFYLLVVAALVKYVFS